MRYACGECATYRILQLEDNSLSPKKLKDKDSLTPEERDSIIPVGFYQPAEDKREEARRADGKALPGREFNLKFPTRLMEHRFTRQNRWPACYIYWLKGYPTINMLPDAEEMVTNHFIVSEYKIIRVKQCDAQRDTESARAA